MLFTFAYIRIGLRRIDQLAPYGQQMQLLLPLLLLQQQLYVPYGDTVIIRAREPWAQPAVSIIAIG